MREIKFRAWDTINDVMCGVNSLDFDTREVYLGYPAVGKIRLEDVELMQFTGLRDKNGKEIYEGDIFKWDRKHEVGTFEVMFLSGAFLRGPLTLAYCINNKTLCVENGEIIGNIHENPELLEDNDAM